MAAIEKIQASLYAMGKRLNGYHLLMNPKGTSPTEVNMIKYRYRTTEHWDDMFYFERIKKTFSKDGNHKEEKRSLLSTHYMDVNNLQLTTHPRKKSINYIVMKDKECLVFSEREDISPEKAKKRKVPKLSFDSKGFFDDSEYDNMLKTKKRAELNRGYYKKEHTLLVKILSLGMHKKMCCPTEKRPNFFKILRYNLLNKD